MANGKHFKSQDDNSFKLQEYAPATYIDPYDDSTQESHEADSSGATHHRSRKRKGARRPKAVAIVLAVIVVLVLGCGVSGFMLYRSALNLKDEARSAMASAGGLKDKFDAADYSGLLSDAEHLSDSLQSIRKETDGILWGAASFIPVYGSDVSAVRELVSVASNLSQSALLPVARGIVDANVSGKLIRDDATVNVPLIQAASSALQVAIPDIKDSSERVQAIGDTHIAQVTDIVDSVKRAFSDASPLIKSASQILPVLPDMLGADGSSRTYLVIAQNNSELRSLGGLPGSWGTLTVTDGAISMGDFSSILHKSGLQVALTDEEMRLTATTATDPAQVNIIPSFPRVAELAKDFWAQMGNGDVDGVIAIDPVFLQRLLALTGGYTAENGLQVDGTTAAKTLLSDTYWLYGNDGDAQDAFFASVASGAFKQIVSGLGKVGFETLWEAIEQSGEDGRLLVWMADSVEEDVVKSFGLDGSLGLDPKTPTLGVYLNDDTTSKISWYTTSKTTIGEGAKNPDGTTTYSVVTTVGNAITEDEAQRAPQYISGGNSKKRDVTDMLNYVLLCAPAGGSISDLTVSEGGLVDGEAPVELGLYGLQVYNVHIHARAGEAVTFSYKVTVSADAETSLALRTTPLAQDSLVR